MPATLAELPSALSQPAAGPATRRPLVDILRLVAAYAIVWLHAPTGLDFARWTALGRFAVPFFTAAAVLLTWEGLVRQPRRSPGTYVRSRVLRIYVPFLAWSGIYLAFKVAKALLLPEAPNDFPGLEVFWLGSFFHLWFMPFVLITTLAVFFAGRTIIGHPGRENAALVMCLLAGWIVAWLPADRESLTVGFGQLAADALPAAFWGLALAIAWQRGADRWLRRPALGWIALALTAASTALVVVLLRNRLLENLAGVALLVFALADWRIGRLARLVQFGGLAYGIYLSHLLFIKSLQAVEAKVGLAETLPVVLGVFGIAAAGSTLLAWLLGRSRWTSWLMG